MKTSARILLFVCCLVSASWSVSQAQTLRMVAFSGDPAPGTQDNALLRPFGAIALDDRGETTFNAHLHAFIITQSNDYGLWSESDGEIVKLARLGDHVPETIGLDFSFLGTFIRNAVGQNVFRADLNGSNNGGIWAGNAGSLHLVAREGNQSPGMPFGTRFRKLDYYPVLNSSGQTAFIGSVWGTGFDSTNNSGIWSEGTGTLQLVARAEQHAPGTPNGVNFSNFETNTTPDYRIALNFAGQTAFFARLKGEGTDTTNDRGIWSERQNSLGLVVRSGDHAPGTPMGVNFSDFSIPGINSAGHTAFSARLTGDGINFSNRHGIWSEGSGSLELVAREGDSAPGIGNGVTFSSFGNVLQKPVIINNLEQVAFWGTLRGTDVDSSNTFGIWSGETNSLRLVARGGDRAPGTPDGVSFSSFGRLTLNSVGQIAFTASLTGEGIDGSNRSGIWAEDRDGTLQLIARAGDLVEVSPGVFRSLSHLSFYSDSGNGDGRGSGFNNLGQLAFAAEIRNFGPLGAGTGIFVSNVVAVPEPTSLTLALFSGLLVLSNRPGRASKEKDWFNDSNIRSCFNSIESLSLNENF